MNYPYDLTPEEHARVLELAQATFRGRMPDLTQIEVEVILHAYVHVIRRHGPRNWRVECQVCRMEREYEQHMEEADSGKQNEYRMDAGARD